MMAAYHPGQPLRNQHLWQWLDHGLVQIQMWSASVSRTGVNYTFFATWMQFCNFEVTCRFSSVTDNLMK